jgi:hypothetical protein
MSESFARNEGGEGEMAKGERFGGRKKGTPNKATAEIKAVAQEYGAEAIETLAEMMRR